jgi:hypothetical protein
MNRNDSFFGIVPIRSGPQSPTQIRIHDIERGRETRAHQPQRGLRTKQPNQHTHNVRQHNSPSAETRPRTHHPPNPDGTRVNRSHNHRRPNQQLNVDRIEAAPSLNLRWRNHQPNSNRTASDACRNHPRSNRKLRCRDRKGADRTPAECRRNSLRKHIRKRPLRCNLELLVQTLMNELNC